MSVAWLGNGAWPLARGGYFLSHHLQPAEQKMPVLGGTGSGQQTDGEVALFGKRLQQADDVAREGSPVPNEGVPRRQSGTG